MPPQPAGIGMRVANILHAQIRLAEAPLVVLGYRKKPDFVPK